MVFTHHYCQINVQQGKLHARVEGDAACYVGIVSGVLQAAAH